MTAIFEPSGELADVDDRALSHALDQWALKFPYRRPLRPDPRLWELFADDRAKFADLSARGKKGGKPRREVTIATPEEGGCKECHRLMRPNKVSATERPNTVQHSANGLCNTCYQLSRRKP